MIKMYKKFYMLRVIIINFCLVFLVATIAFSEQAHADKCYVYIKHAYVCIGFLPFKTNPRDDKENCALWSETGLMTDELHLFDDGLVSFRTYEVTNGGHWTTLFSRTKDAKIRCFH